MKLFKFAACFAVVTAMSLCSGVQAQVVLSSNNGFEDSNVVLDTFGPNEWSVFQVGFGTSTVISMIDPFAGTNHAALAIDGEEASAAGFVQPIEDIVPGEDYTFSLYARSEGATLSGVNAEFRIEYVDADGLVIGDIFANNVDISSSLSDTYAFFTQTNTAPVGATGLQAVVAIQSFGVGDGSNTNAGAFFIDNASVVGPAAVPEPTALGLLGLAVAGLVTRRRRS